MWVDINGFRVRPLKKKQDPDQKFEKKALSGYDRQEDTVSDPKKKPRIWILPDVDPKTFFILIE